MDKVDLGELAERVEKLDGPDRKMDIEIWAACVANQQQLNLVEVGRSLHGDSEADFRADRMSDGRRYTASLDAAMSLVPEGWAWMAGCAPGDGFFATLAPTDESDIEADDVDTNAATPALALTAAALRAHLSTQQDGG